MTQTVSNPIGKLFPTQSGNCFQPNRETVSRTTWKLFLFLLLLLVAVCKSYAQDNHKLVALSKQIIEAKNDDELYPAFEELKDLYFKENKYHEFVGFLQSLIHQKNTLEPQVNYYLGLTRYYQLKYLEERQDWDEYFSQGNAYRDQISQSLQAAFDSLPPDDLLNVYARLVLWRFHRDQNDAFSDEALSDLMSSVFLYAQAGKNPKVLKDAADQLLSYNEKAGAREIYKIYVEQIVASDIKDEELKSIAAGFYKEGNLDLAEAIYDVYLERVSSLPILMEIAQQFAYQDEGLSDPPYAEKVFGKIEAIGGKDAFDEQLWYLRAFNLEKSRDYSAAKDIYTELVQHYPQSSHKDEADYKAGIISTYILRDAKSGRAYFEKLSGSATSPQGISSLYQLGLLSQWEEDLAAAKEYYHKLLAVAKDRFLKTINLAKERLKEIEEARPIEYNLKTFLDVSLKEEYSMLGMGKLDLKAHPYRATKDKEINLNATAYVAASGCFQIELQYLWSGDLGSAKSPAEPSFNTAYPESGTKVVNLVVVSPTGILDRSLILIDIN